MALDSSRLATALTPLIESKIRTAEGLGAVPYAQLTVMAQALAEAIATAVVSEIVTNAVFRIPSWAGGSFSGTVAGAVCTTIIPAQTNITGGIS